MTMAVRDFQGRCAKSHTGKPYAHEAISGLHGLPPMNVDAKRMKEGKDV